jgi:hypothetical protein
VVAQFLAAQAQPDVPRWLADSGDSAAETQTTDPAPKSQDIPASATPDSKPGAAKDAPSPPLQAIDQPTPAKAAAEGSPVKTDMSECERAGLQLRSPHFPSGKLCKQPEAVKIGTVPP